MFIFWVYSILAHTPTSHAFSFRWNSCKQNKQGANNCTVNQNQTPSHEGEKLHSDSGISVDSQSLQEQQGQTQSQTGKCNTQTHTHTHCYPQMHADHSHDTRKHNSPFLKILGKSTKVSVYLLLNSKSGVTDTLSWVGSFFFFFFFLFFESTYIIG